MLVCRDLFFFFWTRPSGSENSQSFHLRQVLSLKVGDWAAVLEVGFSSLTWVGDRANHPSREKDLQPSQL